MVWFMLITFVMYYTATFVVELQLKNVLSVLAEIFS